MVKFNSTKEDDNWISLITKRANEELGITDPISLWMDLDATNSNGTPLDFKKLLGFDKANFGHDIYGIMACIDRETGQLTRCFLPRCARRSEDLARVKKEFTLLKNYKTLEEHQEQEQEAIETICS